MVLATSVWHVQSHPSQLGYLPQAFLAIKLEVKIVLMCPRQADLFSYASGEVEGSQAYKIIKMELPETSHS